MNEPSASSMLYVTAPNPVAILSASVAVTVTSGSVGIVFSSMPTATQSENISDCEIHDSQHSYIIILCAIMYGLNSLYSVESNIGSLSLTSNTLMFTVAVLF